LASSAALRRVDGPVHPAKLSSSPTAQRLRGVRGSGHQSPLIHVWCWSCSKPLHTLSVSVVNFGGATWLPFVIPRLEECNVEDRPNGWGKVHLILPGLICEIHVVHRFKYAAWLRVVR